VPGMDQRNFSDSFVPLGGSCLFKYVYIWR
jgi:hypothetical protein